MTVPREFGVRKLRIKKFPFADEHKSKIFLNCSRQPEQNTISVRFTTEEVPFPSAGRAVEPGEGEAGGNPPRAPFPCRETQQRIHYASTSLRDAK